MKLIKLFPSSWPNEKIHKAIGASHYSIAEARRERPDETIGATNQRRPGNQPLDDRTKELVRKFYEHDDNSRQLAGMRDYVTVRGPDGTKIGKIQKKIILYNLSELYESFKMQHVDINIGFSKFCDLRPQHCVPVGADGTHATCLCQLHQNVALMLQGTYSIGDFSITGRDRSARHNLIMS